MARLLTALLPLCYKAINIYVSLLLLTFKHIFKPCCTGTYTCVSIVARLAEELPPHLLHEFFKSAHAMLCHTSQLVTASEDATHLMFDVNIFKTDSKSYVLNVKL